MFTTCFHDDAAARRSLVVMWLLFAHQTCLLPEPNHLQENFIFRCLPIPDSMERVDSAAGGPNLKKRVVLISVGLVTEKTAIRIALIDARPLLLPLTFPCTRAFLYARLRWNR